MSLGELTGQFLKTAEEGFVAAGVTKAAEVDGPTREIKTGPMGHAQDVAARAQIVALDTAVPVLPTGAVTKLGLVKPNDPVTGFQGTELNRAAEMHAKLDAPSGPGIST